MAKQWFKQGVLPILNRKMDVFFLLLVIYVWARLFQYVSGYFSWPMDGDQSFLYYIAWLMNEHDYVPYRDVHETSFFGTFIFYSSLTRLIGYSTTAFHWADLFFFGLLSLITFGILKPFGKLCALLAIGLFGEFYFKMGFGVHLQRDFVALLPAALALLILQQKRFSISKRSFVVGILFGTASCIKPQFAGGILVAIGYLTLAEKQAADILFKRFIYISICGLAGFASVWVAGFAWLLAHGVASEFLDMAIHYLPAYSSINGRNFARESVDAWTGAGKWLWGMVWLWAIPVAISVYGVLGANNSGRKQNRYWVIALVMCWLLYLLYVPMAGKYWGYHILPSYYFLAILLGFMPASVGAIKNTISAAMVIVIWALVYLFLVGEEDVEKKNQQLIASAEGSRLATRELEEFLKNTLRDGDTIQAHVSHTRGAVFPALLASGAIPATPYLENYLLYHDIDSPFVKKARESFLSRLQQHPPRFIVYTPTLFGFRGPGTEIMFMPFEQWMKKHYRLVFVPSRDDVPAFDRVEVYEYQKDF